MRFVPETTSASKHDRRTWLVVHPKGLVARVDASGLAFPTDDEARALGFQPTDAHRLGSFDGTDALTVPVDGRIEPPFEVLGLRMLAGFLDSDLFGVVARAIHACDWLTTTRFCGRCGGTTTRSDTERCSHCASCGLRSYPRISPAIITLVRKGKLALLAHNASFPHGFYSTLAGFADLGESLEETLVREVKEEVGVAVGNVRYFGSQPWPSPNSLMIAFTADWESGAIEIDGTEIVDAQWFSVDQLPLLPPPLTIARRLIDAWIDEVRGSTGES
jgi:NAD+ diphosphatase